MSASEYGMYQRFLPFFLSFYLVSHSFIRRCFVQTRSHLAPSSRTVGCFIYVDDRRIYRFSILLIPSGICMFILSMYPDAARSGSWIRTAPINPPSPLVRSVRAHSASTENLFYDMERGPRVSLFGRFRQCRVASAQEFIYDMERGPRVSTCLSLTHIRRKVSIGFQ
jgi:hypothetical protein